MKKNILVLLLSFALAAVFAQAPQQVNYQAVVRDATGQLLPTGTVVAVRFDIHEGSPTGPVVFTETSTATTNKFGLITYAIGSASSLTVVNWSGGSKYLQVLIDPTGGSNFADMGTAQLLSVPYALFAGNSAIGPVGPTGPPGPRGITGASGSGGGARSTPSGVRW